MANASDVTGDVEEGPDFRWVVHQAAGMVSLQLDVSVAESLIRLQAYAFHHGRLVEQVARDVVERRLIFDAET